MLNYSFLIFSVVVFIFNSGEGCSISGFDCGDGQCIPGSWQCDREVDCNNGADEKLCNVGGDICRYNQVKCNSTNECIFTHWQCDGEEDCPDGEDEVNCLARACPFGRFSCSLSKVECIPQSWRCDGDLDCSSGDDELDCNVLNQCTSHEFQCDSRECILNTWRCDGDLDCSDGTDEVNCTP
ncbi:hypothetical protein EB796_022048 [Bugula neritina]|uniref:Uncharacterized protein n=1 Tax=Bugula neritina TaxID=10212 RepID=A0A7J7J0C2_BUGNE|nr:hypothetical protein EB796_022048 [Bugula neritina]